MTEEFKTLRGFLNGSEPDEEIYFAYSATLRIFGDIADLDEITTRLGFKPTNTHRKGDKRSPSATPYPHDMWSYQPTVNEDEPLEKHIEALWSQLKPHKDYLMGLKQELSVDIFLGYRSNCDHAGIDIPYTALTMFVELEIPFGISIIIA